MKNKNYTRISFKQQIIICLMVFILIFGLLSIFLQILSIKDIIDNHKTLSTSLLIKKYKEIADDIEVNKSNTIEFEGMSITFGKTTVQELINYGNYLIDGPYSENYHYSDDYSGLTLMNKNEIQKLKYMDPLGIGSVTLYGKNNSNVFNVSYQSFEKTSKINDYDFSIPDYNNCYISGIEITVDNSDFYNFKVGDISQNDNYFSITNKLGKYRESHSEDSKIDSEKHDFGYSDYSWNINKNIELYYEEYRENYYEYKPGMRKFNFMYY